MLEAVDVEVNEAWDQVIRLAVNGLINSAIYFLVMSNWAPI